MKKTIPFWVFVIVTQFWVNTALAQKSDTTNVKYEVWKQRLYFGAGVGYPTIPFINLGVAFYETVYFDAFVEPNYSKIYATYFTIGYQKNKLFHSELSGQIGLCLMQVPDKTETVKYNHAAINIKLIKPLSKRWGLFVSGYLGYPDSRTYYKELVNINIGVNVYVDEVPNLAFWLE